MLEVALLVLDVLLKLLTRLLLRLECCREEDLGLVLMGLVSETLCNDDRLELNATLAAIDEDDEVRLVLGSCGCGWGCSCRC